MNPIAVKGDIVTIDTDAIVNAANTSLLGGGGVDGAIHRAAGPELLEACRRLRGCHTGEAKLTNAFKLQANYIIHTVGPVWRGGDENEPELLSRCYQSCLDLAEKNALQSIAFPAISTGVYGYPVEPATQIAVTSTKEHLKRNSDLQVTFVCFDDDTLDIYQQALA